MEEASTSNGSRKLTRASKPKARTGCLTCKLRHVKCDEAKPQCVRCTSLGRRCGGYEHLNRSKNSPQDGSGTPESSGVTTSLTIVRPLVVFVASSNEERRAIEFFHHKAAPQLSGYFHSRFWSELVLQVANDEPAVRHAMIALSSIYESDVHAHSESPHVATKRRDFGLESYNRAIRLLIADMGNGKSVRVPLMTCVVFVCVDCLRGDIPIALKHIEGGMKLLETWRKQHHDPARRDELLRSVDFEIVEKQLCPMFAWLNMATAIFGRPTVSVAFLSADGARATDTTRPPFRSIHDAISSFLDLIDPAIKLIQANVQSKYVGIEPEAIAEQTRLGALMDDWNLSFDHLMQNERTVPMNGYNVMLSTTMSVRVWLEACLSPDEMIWDNYKSKFEEMVQLAEPIVYDSVRFPDEPSKSFSFELGIIPTLQFVAWKCRWPKIRRKALQLLRHAPKRECVYDASYAYALYEKVRELEESALNLSPGETPADDQLPPEYARIHVIDLPALASTSKGRPVNLLTRPGGSGQGWSVRSEFLHLDEDEKLIELEDGQGSDIVEAFSTGFWSPRISKAPSSGSAGDGTSTESHAPAVPVKLTHNQSLIDEESTHIGETSRRFSLRPGEMDASMVVIKGRIPTAASMNGYSGIMQPLASEPATFVG
ncbi:hypothetical protein EG327_009792 [Venturia inaequalis]|uniref:Zn(2)-C6 fungal-type domain-containing protein n=1 Tax=Venturia inaequalis TaxID=5025 RepID=A0A8H3YS64_VENIN|nr:hypothetical protein EG327_009792 [Venturia inaequalis]